MHSLFNTEKKYIQTYDFVGLNVIEEDLGGNGIFDLQESATILGRWIYLPSSILHPKLSF